MANLSIPLDVCLQLQAELAALSPNEHQPGLFFLQTQINTVLTTLSAAANKRSRPASLDNTPKKKAPKLNNRKQTSRNDGRKRKPKKTVSEDEDSGDEEESEEEGESGEEKESGEEGEGEEVEAAALPAGGEGGESLGGTSVVEGPIQALTGSSPEKVKKPIAKTWETVENLRRLSDNSRSIIRTLAASSQGTQAQSLVLLHDRLSVSTQDNSQITSLDAILKRCIITDVNVVESKFLHMVALMQLALWLSE
jgi:hypothetical protein